MKPPIEYRPKFKAPQRSIVMEEPEPAISFSEAEEMLARIRAANRKRQAEFRLRQKAKKAKK